MQSTPLPACERYDQASDFIKYVTRRRQETGSNHYHPIRIRAINNSGKVEHRCGVFRGPALEPTLFLEMINEDIIPYTKMYRCVDYFNVRTHTWTRPY